MYNILFYMSSRSVTWLHMQIPHYAVLKQLAPQFGQKNITWLRHVCPCSS